MPVRSLRSWLTGALVLAASVSALAQRGGYLPYEPKVDKPVYDGRFVFTRGKYTVADGGFYFAGCGHCPSWAHGMPLAEDNLVKIITAISTVDAHTDLSNVVALDSPDLFKFPIVYITEASFWITNDKEAANFRAYLDKGGFAIFDDFRGPGRIPSGGGWGQFETSMRRALPNMQVFDMDIKDPIFHCFFDINSFDIIPQYYDVNRPRIRGIYQDNDPTKRLMAIINFDTDVSEFWEFSATGVRSVPDTNEAYKLGVNYIIYGLTH